MSAYLEAEDFQALGGREVGESNFYGRPISVSSAALEASHIIRSGAGVLLGISGFNNKGSAQFVQLFDAATLPADNAVPVFVLTAATVANFAQDFGYWGKTFQQGIVICNSSTAATKTIASADCFFEARYV